MRVVQLERRGEALGREVRVRPHFEREVRRAGLRARGRRRGSGISSASICCSTRLQLGLQLGPLIFGLARVLFFDQAPQAAIGEMMHRRVQHVTPESAARARRRKAAAPATRGGNAAAPTPSPMRAPGTRARRTPSAAPAPSTAPRRSRAEKSRWREREAPAARTPRRATLPLRGMRHGSVINTTSDDAGPEDDRLREEQARRANARRAETSGCSEKCSASTDVAEIALPSSTS